MPSIFLPPQFQSPPEHCTASFFGHAGECSLNCCASLLRRMEIRGDIHLRPKQPTLHNLPPSLPPPRCPCPSHPCPMAHVCVRGAPRGPSAPLHFWMAVAAMAAAAAISHHHLGMIRKLALPLISSLARAPSYAPLSLPELRRGIFKKLSEFRETGA